MPSLACESLPRATSAGVIARPVSFRSFSFRGGLGSRLPSMTQFGKPFKSLRCRRAKSLDEPQLEESKTWPLSDESTSLPSDLCDPPFPPPRPEGDENRASGGEKQEETMTAEQELRSKVRRRARRERRSTQPQSMRGACESNREANDAWQMSASELLDYVLGLLPVLRHVAAYEGLLDLRQLVEEGLARGDDEAARVKVKGRAPSLDNEGGGRLTSEAWRWLRLDRRGWRRTRPWWSSWRRSSGWARRARTCSTRTCPSRARAGRSVRATATPRPTARLAGVGQACSGLPLSAGFVVVLCAGCGRRQVHPCED